jgi:hypothetical protein
MKLWVAGLAGLFLLVNAGHAGAQSIAEVARKEAARRKAISGTGKVLTDGNLRRDTSTATAPSTPANPATASTPTAPGPEPAPPAADAAAPPAQPPRTEAYWRERVAAEREALARAQTFSEALQTRINALTTDVANRNNRAQTDGIATDRQKSVAELNRVNQDIKDRQAAIASIQDEARKAGVPPAWVQ